MPRPATLKSEEALILQKWLAAVLDDKFAKQEVVLRAIVKGQPVAFRGLKEEVNESEPASPTKSVSDQEEWVFQEPEIPETGPEATKEEKASKRKSRTKRFKALLEQHGSDTRSTETCLERFIRGPLDYYMGLIVCVNMIMMVISAQQMGTRADASLNAAPLARNGWEETFFEVSDYIFFALYLVDVVVRIYVLRRYWMYDESEGGIMYMNIFDGFLVVTNFLEIFVLPHVISGDASQASSARVVKLLRLSRALRLVRTVNVFYQLRILMATCVASLGALFWSMVLMLLLKMGFALIMCQSLHSFIMDESNDLDFRIWLNQTYGDFFKSLYTVYEITFSGGWPNYTRPVIEKASPLYAIIFLTYVTVVVFAVIRIVTALFIKETLMCAANNAELAMEDKRRAGEDYRRRLEEFFHSVDGDGDGNLTDEEFLEALQLPGVQAYLNVLDINMKELAHLFQLLDDGDGVITINEFCTGITHLKGQARALDITLLHHEALKIQTECSRLKDGMEYLAKSLGCPLPPLLGKRA